MADNEEQQSGSPESGEAEGGNGKESFMQRMKKAPPWVWIGLAIAAATLIIGYIALRNSSGSSSTNPLTSTSGNNPTSPSSPGAAPGQGQGANSGGPYATQGEYNALQNELQQLQQEIQNWHRGGGRGGHGGGGKGGHHKVLQSVYTVGG